MRFDPLQVNTVYLNNNIHHSSCPFCDSGDMRMIGKIEYDANLVFSSVTISLKNVPELWKCNECNSGFTQYAIAEEDAITLYTSGVGGERWVSNLFEKEKPKNVVEVLRKLFYPGARLLDIGCNTGELLDFARSNGCLTAGLELSVESRKFIAEKGHIAISYIDELDCRYDLISGFDLIEHVYNIKEFIACCIDRLEDDGKLVFLTGDLASISARMCREKWWYLRFPEHVMFPSIKFYQSLPGVELVSWVPTYASNKFIYPVSKRIVAFLKGMIRSNYSAQPTLFPDHRLVVLKKCRHA